MILQVIFLICAFFSSLCIVTAIKQKRHNIGYLIMTAFIVACDIICFRLLGCRSVVDARNVLTAYYICYTWFYFGMLMMIMLISRRKQYILLCIPSTVICIVQTVIMFANYSMNRIMTLSRHLLFGGAWWVAEDGKNKSDANAFLSFHTFRVLMLINLILILLILIVCCVQSAKLFRTRFYIFIIMQIMLLSVEFTISMRTFPVWIMCLVINIIAVIGLYLTSFYAQKALTDWSLIRFANEMSDGFLLYNEHGDLIYVNDLLKYAFPPGLIKSFDSRDNLDEWISETTITDNGGMLKYELEGKNTYYKVKKTELTDYDSDLGTIYILHDTTESILKMQAMEEANVELERAAKMKSDFLANMSHEIRTPMNAVIGMAEIALRENLPPSVEDYLLQIQNSGRNLLNIINDILDFSKIEAGKMEIIQDRYEPLSEIDDIANVLATRIGDKKLELFVICDNKLPHALYGDVMRIRQILINLANNAIKFTKEGMVLVNITVEPINENQINLVFHVVDTGQGIKKEDLDKLFVSFQQVDSKRNRSVEGTGLGLAISQRLCEAMNGKIGVTSEYGKGSDFYFSIPQRIMDPSLDIVVEDAETKHAFVINERPDMLGMFIDEMKALGVDGHVIPNLSSFDPTGETDFLFFEEPYYTDEMKKYLDDHKDIIGVILVGYDSTFVSDRENLRIMRRPETTHGMVMVLNGREFKFDSADRHAAFTIDFAAPDAKILIVDDNSINITIAEGLIKPIMAKCYGADSGSKAIEMIKEEDFDIILMDHMMPDMDGIETTRVIRETIPKASTTPIIALTANAMEGVKDMFIREGMNDFVAKPIDIKNLSEKLKQWLPDNKIVMGDDLSSLIEASSGAEGNSGGFGADGSQASSGDDPGEIFIEYEGLDHKKAITALGSAELYQTIVKEYYRSGKDRYNEIKSAYDNEDWSDYTIKVHALKSSSRQIGALVLGDMAEELENAGKDSNIELIHNKTMNVLNAFDDILNGLSQYYIEEQVDESTLTEISNEDLIVILDEFLEACDNLDMDEMERYKDKLLSHHYTDDIKSYITRISDAVDDIDVGLCEELVGNIKDLIS